jgi:hypothetical protein
LSDYAPAKLTARVQKDLRMRLFEHMQQVNIVFFQQTRSSELLSYFTVDLPAIERAMNVLSHKEQLERIPMISLLLVNLSIIAFGSYLALRGYITLGSLAAFFTMYTSMVNSVFNLTFTVSTLTDASVSIHTQLKGAVSLVVSDLMRQPLSSGTIIWTLLRLSVIELLSSSILSRRRLRSPFGGSIHKLLRTHPQKKGTLPKGQSRPYETVPSLH